MVGKGAELFEGGLKSGRVGEACLFRRMKSSGCGGVGVVCGGGGKWGKEDRAGKFKSRKTGRIEPSAGTPGELWAAIKILP